MLLMAGIFCSGCLSMTGGTARTMEPGESSSAVGTSLVINPNNGGVYPAPQFIHRWGQTERVDLGIRIVGLGVLMEPRLQLLRSEDEDWGLDVLTGLKAGALVDAVFGDDFFAPIPVFFLEVPLVIGWNFSWGQVFGVGKGTVRRTPFPINIGTVLTASAGLGFALDVTDTFQIIPDILVSITRPNDYFPQFEEPFALQAGVAFVFTR